MLLGGAVAAGVAAAMGVLDADNNGAAGSDQGGADQDLDWLTSVLVVGPVATVLSVLPAVKAGWGAFKGYSEDLSKLAQLGEEEASDPDFSGMLGVMPKVKAELDLLGELMKASNDCLAC
jgi:type IV secretory pathway VirB2 component (pilin)